MPHILSGAKSRGLHFTSGKALSIARRFMHPAPGQLVLPRATVPEERPAKAQRQTLGQYRLGPSAPGRTNGRLRAVILSTSWPSAFACNFPDSCYPRLRANLLLKSATRGQALEGSLRPGPPARRPARQWTGFVASGSFGLMAILTVILIVRHGKYSASDSFFPLLMAFLSIGRAVVTVREGKRRASNAKVGAMP